MVWYQSWLVVDQGWAAFSLVEQLLHSSSWLVEAEPSDEKYQTVDYGSVLGKSGPKTTLGRVFQPSYNRVSYFCLSISDYM